MRHPLTTVLPASQARESPLPSRAHRWLPGRASRAGTASAERCSLRSTDRCARWSIVIVRCAAGPAGTLSRRPPAPVKICNCSQLELCAGTNHRRARVEDSVRLAARSFFGSPRAEPMSPSPLGRSMPRLGCARSSTSLWPTRAITTKFQMAFRRKPQAATPRSSRSIAPTGIAE